MSDIQIYRGGNQQDLYEKTIGITAATHATLGVSLFLTAGLSFYIKAYYNILPGNSLL